VTGASFAGSTVIQAPKTPLSTWIPRLRERLGEPLVQWLARRGHFRAFSSARTSAPGPVRSATSVSDGVRYEMHAKRLVEADVERQASGRWRNGANKSRKTASRLEKK